MTHSTVVLAFDPDFIEEAVLLCVRREEEKGQPDFFKKWHSERDLIYETEEGAAREEGFKQFYFKWFTQFGFRSRFEAVLDSFPILKCPFLTIRIRRAFAPKEEGSELYVRGEIKTSVVMLEPVRLFEGGSAERFLCREWLRLSDMLDPEFQYSPDADLGSEDELKNELIRERFRALWDDYISARLNAGSGNTPFRFTQAGLIELARQGTGMPRNKFKTQNFRHSAKHRWTDPSFGGKDGGSVLWRTKLKT